MPFSVWRVLSRPPSAAFAQGAFAGVVKDTSGAVLPGVTVEARSPALIEGVRSVVTDGAGQYRIVDLRPGTYTLSFSLPGFSTVRREGLELTGSRVVNIDAQMAVGGLQETVTVTGETPVVDIQSSQRQQVMSDEIIAALPAGRSHYDLAALVPGLVGIQFGRAGWQDVGGTNNLQICRDVDSRRQLPRHEDGGQRPELAQPAVLVVGDQLHRRHGDRGRVDDQLRRAGRRSQPAAA